MQSDVGVLLEKYKQLPWYQRWFFPQSLGKALNGIQDNELDCEQLLPVYQSFAQTYESPFWFISSWINSSLEGFLCSGRYIGLADPKGNSYQLGRTELMNKAYQSSLLDGDFAQSNFKAIALNEGSPEWIINVLSILRQAGLLAQTNIDNLTECRQHRDLVTVLDDLFASGLLTDERGQANFNLMLNYQGNFTLFAQALSQLKTKGLLAEEEAQANFKLLMDFSNKDLSKLLSKQNITQESFDRLVEESQSVNTQDGFTDRNYPVSVKAKSGKVKFFDQSAKDEENEEDEVDEEAEVDEDKTHYQQFGK